VDLVLRRCSGREVKAVATRAFTLRGAGFAASAKRAAAQNLLIMTAARALAEGESLSDGGVPGRGPAQPIAPYHAINYSAEVGISEDGVDGHSSSG
jgi:hypothetical protein